MVGCGETVVCHVNDWRKKNNLGVLICVTSTEAITLSAECLPSFDSTDSVL
jgi:hypothetical protein